MYNPHFRQNKKGLPILKKTEINSIAEKFVLDFDPDALSDPHPIDIDQFTEFYFGLQLDYDYLSNCQCFLGMTVFHTSDNIIIYDPKTKTAEFRSADCGTVILERSLYESKQFHRLRFTLAHECGHWIFHKSYYGYRPCEVFLFPQENYFVQCREVNQPDRLYNRGDKRSDYQWLEWQADKFAAAILMPETAVRNFLSVKGIYSYPEVERLVFEISKTFDVSKQAALYRLYDLNICRDSARMNSTEGQLSLF